jgi:DNA adenine methylase
VQIDHDTWQRILPRYDTPETFFYLDPPYMPSTRKGGKYKHEMDAGEHVELVNAILNLQGKVLLSCYDHDIYQPLADAGWTKQLWNTACHVVGRTRGTGISGTGAALKTQPRTEAVYRNYGQAELIPKEIKLGTGITP